MRRIKEKIMDYVPDRNMKEYFSEKLGVTPQHNNIQTVPPTTDHDYQNAYAHMPPQQISQHMPPQMHDQPAYMPTQEISYAPPISDYEEPKTKSKKRGLFG